MIVDLTRLLVENKVCWYAAEIHFLYLTNFIIIPKLGTLIICLPKKIFVLVYNMINCSRTSESLLKGKPGERS